MRPLLDYQKSRRLVAWLLRNRSFQSRRRRLQAIDYLNAGCGPQVTPGFVNLDYRWVPGVDVVWDLLRPLPFPSGRFRGIFCEHCLEHFFPPDLQTILAEFHRVLHPGGRVRLVVPSLEIHARNYLTARDRLNDPPTADFEASAPAEAINRVFYSGHDWMQKSRWSSDGHHFMHDAHSLGAQLQRAGFREIASFQQGSGVDPRLLVDRPDRAWESLYLEAIKSPAAITTP